MKNDSKNLMLKTFLLGLAATMLYLTLFLEQDLVLQKFSVPSLTGAFFIIAVAFVFSLVHGAFTSSFWTAIGVEASKNLSKTK